MMKVGNETGLPVTLVATSAGAYEGNKMYNIAEEARAEGMHIRPQIAGRPTGVLHGLQSSFQAFVRHPTLPTATMRWPSMATSPWNESLPVPSMMVPPRMTRSCRVRAP